MSTADMWFGSIDAPIEDKEELESLGVYLGDRTDTGWTDCVVLEETMAKLENYWGRWIWTLWQN